MATGIKLVFCKWRLSLSRAVSCYIESNFFSNFGHSNYNEWFKMGPHAVFTHLPKTLCEALEKLDVSQDSMWKLQELPYETEKAVIQWQYAVGTWLIPNFQGSQVAGTKLLFYRRKVDENGVTLIAKFVSDFLVASTNNSFFALHNLSTSSSNATKPETSLDRSF